MFDFSLVAVNGFITEEGLTTLMIGFYEKLTGETFEQQDVEEDVEVSGSNQGQIKGQIRGRLGGQSGSNSGKNRGSTRGLEIRVGF